MDIEIVDLPINSMVIFHSYASLPEGRSTIGSKQCQNDGINIKWIIYCQAFAVAASPHEIQKSPLH